MDLLVCDNDGTLYDDSGTREQFTKIFFEYCSLLLNIPLEQTYYEILKLKKKWDTEFSILALVKEYHLDFSNTVNNTYLKIKLEECGIATPDTAKLKVLNSIKSRKVIFTNNPSVFARRTLSYIGLVGCFSDFIGMEETKFYSKPNPKAYKTVEARHKGCERIIFCDDSLQNLEIARQLGWITVWYRPMAARVEEEKKHIVINTFEELLKLF